MRNFTNIVRLLQMGFVEFKVADLRGCRGRAKKKSTASAPTRANRYAQYKKSLLIFTTSVHFIFGLRLGRALIENAWTRMSATAHPP